MWKTNSNERRPLWYASLGLALLLAATSCQSRGTSQDTYLGGEGAETKRIEGTSGISGSLEMVGVHSERRDGRLFVQFELHNKRGSNLAFEWSAEWFDDGGFKIDWPDHWTPAMITGKGFEVISLTGPTPNATSWRLNVQKPNSVH